jgi:hypothetical protein
MYAPEELEQYTTEEAKQKITYDQHGNEQGDQFDLGCDGAFSDFGVLLGLFYQELDFKKEIGPALTKKGFKTLAFHSREEAKFVEALKTGNWDAVWVVSTSTFGASEEVKKEFIEEILKHHKLGKGLFLWGDNDPFNCHANLVLPQIANCKLGGSDYASQLLSFGSGDAKQQFDSQHIVFAGINKLFEGITIAVPSPATGSSYDLKTLATSSHSHPCILYREDPHLGRVIVDTGFTKLYINWDSAGQSRYVANANVWLLNIEDRI